MNRKFAEARVEMEKALAKYPNNFEIVRQCANTFCLMGVELSDDSAHRRQLELYKKALTLIGQNTDPNFSEWSIKNRIAEAHVCLGESDKALELMKANNAQGSNNCNIATVLVENSGKYDDGLDYMYDDLVNSVAHLATDAVCGALAYVALGNPRDAERLVNWTVAMYDGLAVPGVCHVQRGSGRLRLFAAFAALADGRREDAATYLAKARALFGEYLRANDNSLKATWVKNGEKYRTFDDLGDDVLAGARAKLEKLQGRLIKAQDALPDFDRHGKTLSEIWDECV